MRDLLTMLKLKLGSGWLWPKWPMHWWPNMCSEKVTPQRFQRDMISFSLQLHEVAFARRDVGSWWWLLWTQVITQERFRWKKYKFIHFNQVHPGPPLHSWGGSLQIWFRLWEERISHLRGGLHRSPFQKYLILPLSIRTNLRHKALPKQHWH